MAEPSFLLAGTYQILAEIGAGGGGVVYKAWHTRLEKEVVIKSLRSGTAASVATQRIEVDILKNLKHPYLPQVFDFIVDGGQVYTVMEFIAGESFDRLLKRGETFTQPQVVGWARQLCEALDYLHTRDVPILHSDIKPANVMLTPQGDICLIDFNISLALGEDGAIAIGRSSGYASPEHYGPVGGAGDTFAGQSTLLQDAAATTVAMEAQATVPLISPSSGSSARRRGIRLDKRSDIYSLGATLYHLLSGQRPAARAADVLPLASLGNFSSGLVSIIEKAMCPDPAGRFQSAGELRRAVNGIHQADPRWKRYCVIRGAVASLLTVMLSLSVLCVVWGQHQVGREEQSRLLAARSAATLATGNRGEAVSLALESLPTSGGFFDRPYVAAGEKALADALGVYDLTGGYKPYHTIPLVAAPHKLLLSPDETYTAVFSPYEVSVYETATATKVAGLPTARTAWVSMAFLNDSCLLFTDEAGLVAYDLTAQRELWRAGPAAAVAVSENRQVIAAVNSEGSAVTLYMQDGTEQLSIPFEDRRYYIPVNDSFIDPDYRLLCLDYNGSRLAVSFDDGTLAVYDFTGETGETVLYGPSEALRFSGGFCGSYFAFAAVGSDGSVFAVVELDSMEQTAGLQADSLFLASAGQQGICLSGGALLVEIDPKDGGQTAVASVNGNIIAYQRRGGDYILSTDDGKYIVVTGSTATYDSPYPLSSLALGGNWALAGGPDSPNLRILRREEASGEQVLDVGPEMAFDEARVRADGNRIMVYDYRGFALYDGEGRKLHQVELPDPMYVTDQQFDRESGNLAVLYRDALYIYSGEDGALLWQATGLRSVFYSPSGLSVLDRDGGLQLVDLGLAQVVQEERVPESADFAIVCGGVLYRESGSLFFDNGSGGMNLLGSGEVIGAQQTPNGDWLVAITDEVQGSLVRVKQGGISQQFAFEGSLPSEAHFLPGGSHVVVSPLHGVPRLYSIPEGTLLRELEQDAYLTGIAWMGGKLVSEYISADGGRFSLLLDVEHLETLAALPGYLDAYDGWFLGNSGAGDLRQAKILNLEELCGLAGAYLAEAG